MIYQFEVPYEIEICGDCPMNYHHTERMYIECQHPEAPKKSNVRDEDEIEQPKPEWCPLKRVSQLAARLIQDFEKNFEKRMKLQMQGSTGIGIVCGGPHTTHPSGILNNMSGMHITSRGPAVAPTFGPNNELLSVDIISPEKSIYITDVPYQGEGYKKLVDEMEKELSKNVRYQPGRVCISKGDKK
jgi:hypothetical protein